MSQQECRCSSGADADPGDEDDGLEGLREAMSRMTAAALGADPSVAGIRRRLGLPPEPRLTTDKICAGCGGVAEPGVSGHHAHRNCPRFVYSSRPVRSPE